MFIKMMKKNALFPIILKHFLKKKIPNFAALKKTNEAFTT